MNKYLFISVAILILIAGGLYTYKYRNCLKQLSYIPPREQIETGGGLSGLQRIADKGNYYRIYGAEFRTFDDAMSACMWK